MAFFDFLFGKKPSLEKIPTMNKGQSALLNQLSSMLRGANFDITQRPEFQGASNFFQSLLDPSSEAMQAFQAPAMRQFNEQIIPGIAERFAGSGGLSSGAFQQALRQGAGGLAENLAALRGQLGLAGAAGAGNLAQASISPYLSLLGPTLGAQPFGYQRNPGSPGLLGYVGQGLGAGLGMGLGGGLGGALGGAFGSLFGPSASSGLGV